MRVLVLGGDGFCGWPTALHLSDRGHDVTRRRWSCGSTYNFARFVPFASGSAGLQFWFAGSFTGVRRLSQPMQFAVYLFAIQATLLDPGVRQNLPHLLAFLILATLPMLLVTIYALFYRRLWRSLLRRPLFLGFTMVRRLANVEALLVPQTRPARPAWYRPRLRTAVEWPVLAPRRLYLSDLSLSVRSTQP